ncbi:non-ribosomal peptide synthetase [Nocardia brasiliensis]|uniref:non-ribosomal peptide synthetase n=1 Tax=Nocardia brasiliensis TaxID=37326 RepID=UPI001894BE2E|nr:non-ribosomal peptide synthetase [Nocardia brasiliensis]MBF6125119.1 amino acid adenylation domain-containing protein [Nocardia brasiliensis]
MSTIANAEPLPDSSAADGAARHPLSAGQRRVWFLQTRDPDDTTLNISVAHRLSGELDVDRLRAAVDSVLARHEILRTTYGSGVDGEPYQVIRDDIVLSWHEYDLSELAEASRARRVEVLARRELGRPFELTTEAPLRCTLIRTGPTEFVFVLVVHTICWDDDSWSVFRTELNAAYHGSAPLSARPAQFAEVAVLDGAQPEPGDAALEYWRNTLQPLPESLELPGRSVIAGPRNIGRHVRRVSAELVAKVDAFAEAHDSVPYVVLLAAYHTLLHRYTAATDFLISVPVTTRGPAAISSLGYFGNTVLLRTTSQPSDSFAGVAAGVLDTCAVAFEHQEVGIDRVVREINPDRVDGRDGLEQLVQVGFGVREGARGYEFDGVTATELELGSPSAQVPLRFTVVLDQDGVLVTAEYWTDHFDGAIVERLLMHYIQLLDAAIGAPDVPIGEIDMFGDLDRTRILCQSHGDLVRTPQTTMVALFEARVADSPTAIAIVEPRRDSAAGRTLTYCELNQRANRLAHWLIGQGIGSEDLVALRVANSVEFVVGVLGVLKAGAAYLPIDPGNPDERIDELIRDARPRLVFGRVELAAAEESAVDLPEHDPVDADRVRPLRPGNLAYVIYTSGSTGKPKGVPVSHAAVAEHLDGFCAEWKMTATDRLLQAAPVSFDASLLDIFVTFNVGACLVIPKPGAFRDIPYVADLIARCGVTVLHLVPSTLSTFLLLPEVSEWRALRHVPVGGEALLGEVADRFAGVFDAELRNHYGPTEAVVSATHMPVDGPQGTRIVPIGVPNRNVYVYLLDARMQLIPAGVIGEIYLGGRQLARGYLDRPGLTAERFVADPFLPGERLYRTGDLGRRGEDGAIEFVGRADEQVKVRGFRIELGEVEATIATCPGVGHCAVIAVADKAIGSMLAAYVVPAVADLDLEQVRVYAIANLPEYMVPAAFALIDEIPLTAHGKLDKQALPEPVRVTRGYREPSTATEVRLVELYAQILGADRVGADDSFFDLGGHSLLANRLLFRLRDEFGIEIDVRVLFDTPTVAGLAALIESNPVALPDALTTLERQRVLFEWSTGVELSEVLGIVELVQRGRAIPGVRTALRCGAASVTYGELFSTVNSWTSDAKVVAGPPATVPAGASVDRLIRLLAVVSGRSAAVLESAALAAAVADRRAVAADRRGRRTDPAYGSVDVRLVAAYWTDTLVAVELLAAIADGATLIVASESQRADPTALAELVTAHAVTHVVTDAVTAARIAQADGAPLSTVRRWDVLGIDAPATLPTVLAAVAAESVATFAYTVPQYAGVIARGSLDGTGRLRPIPGARVLVLDDGRQPVRPEVIGEVYIGGAALLFDPASDDFVADPFVPGDHLVRTGARARWDAEGWLVFVD